MATLILGATGFIGRNLVTHMVAEHGDVKVVAADKVLPDTAFLSDAERESFESVTFVQKNLINEAQVEKVFEEHGPFDYVINFAAETKYGHSEEVYAERVYSLSMVCARVAAKNGVKRYIEASTAQVYEPDKKAAGEDAKLNPWTLIAKYKLKVEEELSSIEGLRYVVVRPAIVYGRGDRYGLASRIICGAIYKHLNEKMEFLWDAKLKLNTVHVEDVCRAVVFLCSHGDDGAVFNLADKADTDQGSVNKLLEEVFGISTDFKGKMKSALFTKMSMGTVTATVNDKHVGPWSDMCKAKDVVFTPLSPYLDQELLYNRSLSVDGTAIEKLGFEYKHPNVEVESIRDWVRYNENSKLFPAGYMV